MTHIVPPSVYPSKKAFKAAVMQRAKEVSAGISMFSAGTRVYLDDPSLFNPVSGEIQDIMSQRDMVTVTNHPKRSWFACIKRKGNSFICE